MNPSQTHNNQGWGGGEGAPVLTDDVSLQVGRQSSHLFLEVKGAPSVAELEADIFCRSRLKMNRLRQILCWWIFNKVNGITTKPRAKKTTFFVAELGSILSELSLLGAASALAFRIIDDFYVKLNFNLRRENIS